MRKSTLRISSPHARGIVYGFFLSLLSILIYASGYAQTRTPEDKIDPAFRFVMAQPTAAGRLSTKSFSPAIKTTPMKVLAAPGKQEERYDCIIYSSDVTAIRNSGALVNSVLPNFVTAWVTLEQMQRLSNLESVNYIAAPTMSELHNDMAVASSGASLLHQGKLNNTVYKGKGVLVAIFDTGIDWKHPDFRNPDDTTQSRILRIWDQTITPVAGEVSPAGMSYGVEYTQAQINDELDGSPAGFVRENDVNGHGTHVAGTAAGNGAANPTNKYMGMAPEADIIVVKGGNGSFSSSNTINALTYLKNLATTLGKPIVVNMSIGGQAGPHDGTRPDELAVDDFTASARGRAVVISAGNDNGDNLHNQLSLAGGASTTVSFTVPAGTTGTDVFAYRVYVNDNSDITATLTDPSGAAQVTAIAGQNSTGPLLSNSFTGYVFNQVDAGSGDRFVDVYIQRNGSNTTSPAGAWTLSLTNNTAGTITLHGWLYYRNAAFNGTVLTGGNSDYLVGSPGNANSAITVASYTARPSWLSNATGGALQIPNARMDDISSFSSRGPRRDGVIKPEIAAMGQLVTSALSTASAPNAIFIVVPGKYVQNQGTSMAAPVVAGAVALLLQANPAATVTQLRTNLFSNTSTDALTNAPGATPNATWGYGRLDVYKAAGAVFNCSPVNRTTYQYDASNLTADDATASFTTQRVAVRFTPNITGKMGGAYFHTARKTALVMELRTDSSGLPGALLGRVNVPDTAVSTFSWNYADLSDLNIPVTSGADYFVVVYRSPSSSATWGLRREGAGTRDNRSLASADGITWTNPGFDYKIRSVVYSQQTINLAMSNTSNINDIATNNQFIDNNCQLIAQLTPNGASAVSGAVTANVWIEPAVPQHAGKPFVARHYQINPANNATSATGRVTLYFTQAEFDAFNADANSTLNLPANPTDVVGIANLMVVKYGGSSSDGSGLPGTYSGAETIINPADNDIVWNAGASRWEVSFNVTGFSGFIIQTDLTPLPILVESFSGYPKENAHILNWKLTCLNSEPVFEIERSSNGTDFSNIGTRTAPNGCDHTFTFKDNTPLAGYNYYRIKISDNGAAHYTRSILLQTGKMLQSALYPNTIQKGETIQVVCAESEGMLRINDVSGRQVHSQVLATGAQSVTLPISVSGIYFYSIQNNKGTQSGKLIVR